MYGSRLSESGKASLEMSKMNWDRTGKVEVVSTVRKGGSGQWWREPPIQWERHGQKSCGRTKQKASASLVFEEFTSNSCGYLQATYTFITYSNLQFCRDTNSNREAVWVVLANFVAFTITFPFSVEGAT